MQNLIEIIWTVGHYVTYQIKWEMEGYIILVSWEYNHAMSNFLKQVMMFMCETYQKWTK